MGYSKSEEHYLNDDNKRTLDYNKSTNKFGCIRKPLLNIPITNARIDELHMLLRITDLRFYIVYHYGFKVLKK